MPTLAPMQVRLQRTRSAIERHRQRITIALALFTIYLLFGFLAAPRILKGQLEEALSAATAQRATLAGVEVNPLRLSVKLLDLRLTEADGAPLLGVDELLVDVQSSSLFRGALVFGEISIIGPWVEAVVDQDATLNLSRIGATGAPPPPPSTTPEEPPALVIQEFSVIGGRIAYEDRTQPVPSRTEIRIVDLAASDLSTRRGAAGSYSLEATGQRAKFRWQGEVGFNPIASKGSFAISGLDLAAMQQEFAANAVAGELRSGNLDINTEYAVARRADGGFDASLSGARIGITAFAFGARTPADAEPLAPHIELPRFEIAETSFDLASRAVRIGRIEIGEPVLRAALSASGLDLAALLAPPPAQTEATAAADAPAAAPDAAAPAAAGPAWRVALAEFALVGGRIELADATPTTPVLHTIAPLAASLKDATLAPGFAGTLELSAGINGGTLTVGGPIALPAAAPGAADPALAATVAVKLQALGLAPYSPYLAAAGAMDLTRGTLEADGTLVLADGQVGYSGFIGSSDLALRDRGLKQDFLRWKRLQLRGMDAKLPPSPQPLSLTLREVVIEQPYLRMIIGPDRLTNIDHILGTGRPPTPPDDAAASEDAAPVAVAPEPKAGPLPKVRIASVRLVDGSANFADLSLQPSFATAIGELNGTIKGLSSAEKTRAEVTIDGRVDKYAPVTVRGAINPLAAKPTTDLTVKFKDIELTTFTPYSGKFMGMKIEQGRLSLDLRYKLVDRMLEGENKIVLDQFTLGDNVDSPDAMALPVRLAIALLKDSRGVIDLDLPVKGSLDDPQFSYGKIMWKAFVSLITKVVAAPFAALGSMFGGGPDLEKVAFAPGSAFPEPAQQANLDTIAKGLAAKPELRLDVPGATDARLDGEVLARRKVLARVRPDGSAPDAGTLTPKELRALAALFEAKFPEVDPDSVLPPTPEGKKPETVQLGAEQLNRLAAAEPADPAALAELARARGLAIKDYLVTRAALPAERIYLKDANAVAGAKDGQVIVTLELTAP
jgi:hypothetical protein